MYSCLILTAFVRHCGTTETCLRTSSEGADFIMKIWRKRGLSPIGSIQSADQGYVLFDIDGNDGGTKERTGWVKADDGILSVDLNANGTIDNISETFSERFGAGATPGNYASGFSALAQYDTAALGGNGDGKISSADSGFATLSVWRDANGNGTTDAGELLTLAALGITEISLVTQSTQVGSGTATSYQIVAGNEVRATGTYTVSGATRAVASVNFVKSKGSGSN